MHCRAFCYANSELLRLVCGSPAHTHASCPLTQVLEQFVISNLQNTKNCDVTVYFPFNLFTREVSALMVGLATTQNTARTCHACWKRFLVPVYSWICNSNFLSAILMQLMWNPMCPLRVEDAECMPCLRCKFLAASPGPTLLTWQVHETYRCVTYQLKVLAPLFTK